MRDLFLNRAKEGCRLSRTIGEERTEIYRIEAGSVFSLYPTEQSLVFSFICHTIFCDMGLNLVEK